MSIRVRFIDDMRKALWEPIFPEGVPVESYMGMIFPPGEKAPQACYQLKCDDCSREQLDQLMVMLAIEAQLPVQTVRAVLDYGGWAILKPDTVLLINGVESTSLLPNGFKEDFDAEEDFEDDDEFSCPRCGSDLDDDGDCTDAKCGWSLNDLDEDQGMTETVIRFGGDDDEDDYDDEDDIILEIDEADAPPDNPNEIPF